MRTTAWITVSEAPTVTTKTIKAMTAQTKIGTTAATATTAEAVKVTTVRAAAIKTALTARLRVHMALLRAEAIPKKFTDVDTESAGYDAYGNYYIPEFYNYLYIDAGSFKSSVATLLQAASDTFASLGYSDTTCRSVETLMLELSGREFLITDGLEKQLSVPYISQEGSFPNGCESVSATMLLRYYGFDITPDEFIDSYLPCEPVRISWGTRYGPNPKLV